MTDDTELWSRSLSGGAEAFAQLFDRHRDRVFRHAARLVDTRTDAEDAVAVAFLELWRKRRNVQLVNDSILPWLLVTTTNATRNRSRAIRRHTALLKRLPRDTHGPDAADEAFRTDPWRDLDPALRTAMRTLPRKDVELLTLVAFHELTPAEAAEVLGISHGAAKTRLSRLRTKLKTALSDSRGDSPLLAIYGGVS